MVYVHQEKPGLRAPGKAKSPTYCFYWFFLHPVLAGRYVLLRSSAYGVRSRR